MHLVLTDVSDQHTFAVEWAGAAGTRLRLVNRRGTTDLGFQIRYHTGTDWQALPANRRIRLNTPPASFDDFHEVARGPLL